MKVLNCVLLAAAIVSAGCSLTQLKETSCQIYPDFPWCECEDPPNPDPGPTPDPQPVDELRRLDPVMANHGVWPSLIQPTNDPARGIWAWPIDYECTNAESYRFWKNDKWEYRVRFTYTGLQQVPPMTDHSGTPNPHNVNGNCWVIHQTDPTCPDRWVAGTFDYLRVGQADKEFVPYPPGNFFPVKGSRIGILVSTMCRSQVGTEVWKAGSLVSNYQFRSTISWLDWPHDTSYTNGVVVDGGSDSVRAAPRDLVVEPSVQELDEFFKKFGE